MSNLIPWIVAIAIIFIFILVGGLLNFFFSKNILKWFKNVRIINKKNLDKNPKLLWLVHTIKNICANYNLYVPEIGIYPSHEINAFATGRGYDSLIAFSSGIINNFSKDELKGVIAHEISHLINQDFARILIVTGFFDFLFMILNSLLFFFISNKLREKSKEKSLGEQLANVFVYLIIYKTLSSILRILTILPVLSFNRRRELKADRKGAKIVGVEAMLLTLYKLLDMENKQWIVDGLDLTEEDLGFTRQNRETNDRVSDPTSIEVLKFNPENKKRKGDWILGLFRTHPTLEERIAKLKKMRKISNINRFI